MTITTVPSFNPYLSYLETCSNETVVESTVGPLKNASPVNAIITFSSLSRVSRKLNERIGNCWGNLLQHVGVASFLVCSFPKEIDFSALEISKTSENSLKFIKKQFPLMINWSALKTHHATPTFQKFTIPLFSQDLVILNSKFPPIMAPSEQWVVISFTESSHVNEPKIVILDSRLDTPKVLSFKEILHMLCEEDFLYVLCKDEDGLSQLLQYNSKDWNEIPKELPLPDNFVCKFLLTEHELLFISTLENHQCQLSIIEKNDYSQKEPCFARTAFLDHPQCIKAVGNFFFILSENQTTLHTNRPETLLEQLHVNGSEITKICVQKLPTRTCDIIDFDVKLDKVVVIKSNGYPFSCFNLEDGKLIQTFKDYPLKEKRNVNFYPNIEVFPLHIKVTYPDIKYLNTLWTQVQKIVIDLDFTITVPELTSRQI